MRQSALNSFFIVYLSKLLIVEKHHFCPSFLNLNKIFRIFGLIGIFKVKQARVDLTETFSANQLWFRIFSCLFQHCSLPGNLWTALETKIFWAKNQRWFPLKQRLFLTASELRLSVYFSCSSKFLRSSSILAHNSDFHPYLRKEEKNS